MNKTQPWEKWCKAKSKAVFDDCHDNELYILLKSKTSSCIWLQIENQIMFLTTASANSMGPYKP